MRDEVTIGIYRRLSENLVEVPVTMPYGFWLEYAREVREATMRDRNRTQNERNADTPGFLDVPPLEGLDSSSPPH